MSHNKIFNLKFKKNIKNFIINSLIFILSVIAIIVIWGFVQVNVQHKDYINIFGYSVFSAETGSMAPTMEKGDIIIIKIGDEIKENDIITYKQGNALITHRIVEIDGDTIIAKGDNNNTEDEPINKNQVIGKSVFIINNVEIWKKVFTDVRVVIPIFITIVLFVILVAFKEKTGDEDVR